VTVIVGARRGRCRSGAVFVTRIVMLVTMMLVTLMFVTRSVLVTVSLRPVFLPWQVFLSLDPDVHLGRRNAAARDSGNVQSCADSQSCDSLLQHLRRDSGVHQRA